MTTIPQIHPGKDDRPDRRLSTGHHRVCPSNIDSTLPPTLNHCFKNSDAKEFFDTLGYKRTLWERASNVRFTPESRHYEAEYQERLQSCSFTVPTR